MSGNFKHVSSILCDDVRREDNGKFMLIGVYTGGVNFSSPLPVKKRSLSIFSLGRISGRSVELTYRVRHDQSGEVLIAGDVKLELRPDVDPAISEKDELPIELSFPVSPVEFHKPGLHTAQFKVAGGRWKRLLDFDVSAGANAP